jgi:hypothetical protein
MSVINISGGTFSAIAKALSHAAESYRETSAAPRSLNAESLRRDVASQPTNGGKSFKSVSQDDLPVGRKGKHHEIVAQLLKDLSNLKDGRTLKIPLAELPDTKANIRSALSRAAKQRRLTVATSSDELYFYVWNGPAPRQ